MNEDLINDWWAAADFIDLIYFIVGLLFNPKRGNFEGVCIVMTFLFNTLYNKVREQVACFVCFERSAENVHGMWVEMRGKVDNRNG